MATLLFTTISLLSAHAFTAGNLAVFSADSSSANNTTFTIVEVNPTLAGQTSAVSSNAVNGTSGPNALRCSGSATSTGYLSDSADGTLLVFDAVNSTSTSGNANTIATRGVGTFDNSATFNLATTYTAGTSGGTQARCATTLNNSLYYIADQDGLYTNSSTRLTNANVRAIKAFGGGVYILQQSSVAANIVVSSLSLDGRTPTGLTGLTNETTAQDFYLIASGTNGTTFDTLYVTCNTSATAGTIKKYSLVNGVWTNNGSYSTSFGGFGLCAAKNGNGAVLYLTTGTGATAANNVIKVTDTAPYNSPIAVTTGNNVTVYTGASGTTMKGIAFAPSGCTPPATPTAANDGPVNAGDTLHLSTPTVLGATYAWSGPNGFTSSLQNPSIANAQAVNSGIYSVVLTVGSCSSSPGQTTAIVNPAPSAPVVLSITPSNLWAYPGQLANFNASVLGTPTPTVQWKFNGTDIPGETATTLQVAVSDTNQSGIYSLVASNLLGQATNVATLVVTPKPNLVITEVESSENTNDVVVREDWWELSNFDTFPVNLRGFRMDDSSGQLATAVTFTNDVLINPGESVVFVENLTEAQFRAWWGSNLPPAVKIISYSGNGLSLNSDGDGVVVWNAAATSDGDTVATALFTLATRGTTFGYNPATHTFGGLSVAGQYGAFTADVLGDIGSPGTIANHPNFTQATTGVGDITLTFATEPGLNYAVDYTTNLTPAAWLTLTNVAADGTSISVADPAGDAKRFYRARFIP